MGSEQVEEVPSQSANGPAPAEVSSTTPADTQQASGDGALNQVAASENKSETDPPPMSKNALKRLRKQQEWEDGKEDRKRRRREKNRERKDRRREHRDELLAQGVEHSIVFPKKQPSTQVPIALIIDCDFEAYMTDKERISLSSQVTRSYSDNRQAKYRAYLWVAGWQGKLLDRFEGTLESQHKSWKGVGFHEGDFVECAEKAGEKMRDKGGEMIEPLQKSLDQDITWVRDEKDPFPLPDPEPEPKEELKDIVYLTSDSPYTLDRLEPNKSYIVGGLVDKNREKGLCYRRARERGIRTARLPIGQFMVMQSRQVLATNHVVEIMLKWLEYEDWGEAFTAVIPKRKGGVLKGETPGEESIVEGEPRGDEKDAEEGDDEPALQPAEAERKDPELKSEQS